jgi:tetratricopeptide (TPR) repeat protein
VRHQQGRWPEARALYLEALAVARAIGDRQWAGNALSNLGLVLQQQGELDEAGEALRAALQAARELGHRRLECIALSNLGQLAEAQHDDTQARERFEQALVTARDLGDHLTAGQVSGYLGALHTRARRHDLARACFDDGEQLLAGVAGRLSLGMLLCDRAECEHLAGQPEAARRCWAAAQAIAAEAEAGATTELGLRLARLQQQLDEPPRGA